MRIVIAPDSFKGSLSAPDAVRVIEKGMRKAFPRARIDRVPLSDGGEGFLEAIRLSNRSLKIHHSRVTGPLGRKVEASYGILKDAAIIEMAQASGLCLVPAKKRNPMVATTYGTGQLIRNGLNAGVKEVVIGIGGSATVDGGVGCLQVLGAKFLNRGGHEIGFGGASLLDLYKIDLSRLDSRAKGVNFLIASDVDNPLTGRNGAARVYGPQKGATPKMVGLLEQGLRNYARVIRKDIGIDVEYLPGAGAAGGIGAGLIAVTGARLKKGIDIVGALSRLEKRIEKSDLVITGEGKIDAQTSRGKAPIGVARIARKYGIPVIAICGTVDEGYESVYRHGIDAVISIVDLPAQVPTAMEKAPQLIEQAAERIGRILNINLKLHRRSG